MDSTLRTDEIWRQPQLFTVRVWHEQVARGVQEVRIQVRHVLSGETRYFGGWPPLIDYMLTKLEHSPDPANDA